MFQVCLLTSFEFYDMKGIINLKSLVWAILLIITAPSPLTSQTMAERFVSTSIGEIAVQINEVVGSDPIIFLHGVYFDHRLWDYQSSRINNRTVITVDMPLHGRSKNISKINWTLEDCSSMLIEILDSLNIKKTFAVGHSWGSMAILRAAAKSPERFHAIGLCNMPFEASNTKRNLQFRMQHTMLPFRGFYSKQVAKALFGKQSLVENDALFQRLSTPMALLSNKEVKQTDKSVIMKAEDATPHLKKVKSFALALKGEEDYVPDPSAFLKTQIVPGGHVSPLEAPEQVFDLVQKVLAHQLVSSN